MRLSTLFLACFAAASVPALGWSIWTATSAWEGWSQAEASVHAAEAMGDALHVVEALSIERGALQEAALSANPALQELSEIAARNDLLLDRTQRSLHAARLPEQAVIEARAILAKARAHVAESIQRPMPERDPDLVPAIIQLLYQRLDAVEAAVALAQGEAAQASASVGALVAVAGLAVDMRAIAGKRSTYLSGWVGGRALSASQLDELMYLTGQLRFAWMQLRRQVMVMGDPPKLAAAVAQTNDQFFRKAEPVYQELAAAARSGGPPPWKLGEWRRWTVAALPGILPARDAAISEAISVGKNLAADARTRLAIAATATIAALVLAAGALLVLLRRLVLPIEQLTAAVARLAGGDTEMEVPGLARRDEIGAMAAALAVFRQTALTLRQTNVRFSAALENMSQGLCMFDAEACLVVANRRLAQQLGLSAITLTPGVHANELIRQAVQDCTITPKDAEWLREWPSALPGSHPSAPRLWELADGRAFMVHSRRIESGGWLSTFEDFTDRRRAEARIVHMAHHDALTGLPNRVLFRDRLGEALGRARRGESFAVLCLDLDHFKEVNDTLGHPVGDALLRAVTQRLRATLRETDTVARLGGDEFAILQVSTEQPGDATALARRLVADLGAPYQIDGQQMVIGTSIGIALAPDDGDDPDTLLKNADLALYRAKADGRAAWRFFEPEMDARMQERRLLELDLRRALTAGEFELHYQPLVNLRTHRPSGFEALLRWRHPERGLVPPAEFVPLAEEIALIGPIGEWVLRRACAEAVCWPERLKVAVNLSPAQFRPGAGLAAAVADALTASGLEPSRLELEVTEGVMLRDTEETVATLHRIRALGVAISMDDFGTGYSSLSYLRRFPFTKVKIDQSFVRDINGTAGDCAAIVRAVVGLCGSLGMATTAEGVETQEQLDRLAAEGCTEVQGYLFSRPVPAPEVPRLLGKPLAHGNAVLELS